MKNEYYSKDITFCTSGCRKTDCFRHYSKRPKTGFVSVADYKSNGKCPYKEVKDEQSTVDKIQI